MIKAQVNSIGGLCQALDFDAMFGKGEQSGRMGFLKWKYDRWLFDKR